MPAVAEDPNRTVERGVDGSKPLDYYQHARDEMLAFVPEAARTVLDVGCGEGHFGRSLKGPRREVWGIERDTEHAVEAAQQLDRVVVGDVDAVLEQLPKAYFDLVVFNDVLEHLVDPYQLVERIRENLSSNGMVLSSIPNVRYFRTVARLVLRGRWDYEEFGVLDRTHLRFFTSSSIVDMYVRAGFTIIRHEGINPMPEDSFRSRLIGAFLRGPFADMRFLQFATVARPVASDER